MKPIRDNIVSVRLNDKELERLIQAADYLELTVSQVIRRGIKGYVEPHVVIVPPREPWWRRLFAA